MDKATANATAEKTRVAVSSVAASLLLTLLKIVVGVSTRSLGILSEAAHSTLDLVAALVTVFAVKASAKPADDDHPYGHGKVENLSALFETALLVITCLWIIKEAVTRLFFHDVPVKVTLWSFLVVVVSILVDYSRSRALLATARKHNSQALEADALHFSTDVWSSLVVLLGLGLVTLSRILRIPWLVKADAIAALAVAGIVLWVSLELGRKTILDLLDAVPPDLVRLARQEVSLIPGVQEVPRLRLRRTGGECYCDVTVKVDARLSQEEAHRVADAVEACMDRLHPGGDVVVHTEPLTPPLPG